MGCPSFGRREVTAPEDSLQPLGWSRPALAVQGCQLTFGAALVGGLVIPARKSPGARPEQGELQGGRGRWLARRAGARPAPNIASLVRRWNEPPECARVSTLDGIPGWNPSMDTLGKRVLTVGLLSVLACYLLSVILASLDRIKSVDPAAPKTVVGGPTRPSK